MFIEDKINQYRSFNTYDNVDRLSHILQDIFGYILYIFVCLYVYILAGY